MKNVVMKILGQRISGRLEYLLKPELRTSWGGPFNGQEFRQQMFREIISALPFDVIVETGTYHGTTSVYLARTGLPVYTVESNPRFHAFSSLRFRRENPQIHLYEGDTLWFLRMLCGDSELKLARAFFYLDAHWEEHLPLREELEIIFDQWRNAVVMVDDFEVPGMKYGYDDYGPSKTLNLEYLRPLDRFGLTEFFPAIDAEQETGGKRGCVVLAREQETVEKLRRIPSLRCPHVRVTP
jgi:hypothetical protein